MKEYSSGLYGHVFSSGMHGSAVRRKTRTRLGSRSKRIGAGVIGSMNPVRNRVISCHRQRTSRHMEDHNETDTISAKGSRRQRRMSLRSRKQARDHELEQTEETSDTRMTGISQLRGSKYTLVPHPNEPSLTNHLHSQQTHSRLTPSAAGSWRVHLDNEFKQTAPAFSSSQWAVAVYLSLGTFNVGYSVAFHSLAVARHPFDDSNKTNPDSDSFLFSSDRELFWLENLLNLGGWFGSALAGLALRQSRRRIFVLAGFSLTCAWLMALLPYVASTISTSGSPTVIYGARLMAGLSAGLVMVVTPVYLSESVGPQHRGSLSMLPISATFLGSVSCFVSSYLWSSRDPHYYLAAIGASFLSPYLLLIVFILPESPRYLLQLNQPTQSCRVLRQLRGKAATLPALQEEFQAMEKVYASLLEQTTPRYRGRRGWLQRPFLYPVLLGSGLMFFSQFSGMDGVLLYAWHRSFLIAESDPAAQPGQDNWSLIVLYCVQWIASLVAGWNVDKRGRKLLLLLSSAIAAAAAAVLGLLALLEDLAYWSLSSWSHTQWIPAPCVILFTGAHALGMGTVPWIMFGELLPLHHPGWAATIMATFYWTSSVALTVSFPTMQNMLYMSGTFWIYCIFCVLGYLFVLFCVPDVVGQASLEDIRSFFSKRPATDKPNKEDLCGNNVNVC